MWRQQSRIQWLRGGDCNSHFFHSKATQHYRCNWIQSIWDRNNVLRTKEEEIATVFTDYYQELFKTSHLSDFDPVLQGVHPQVTQSMNTKLFQQFTAIKVRQALHQMTAFKARGPDGMLLLLYQNYWFVIGDDITKALLSC